MLVDCINFQTDQIQIRANQLPIGSTYIRCKAYNPNDVNTVVCNYYQIGSISIRTSVLLDLLMVIAEEPMFDILRTKEQLGYDVTCGIRDNHGVLGYTITINSQENKFTAEHIEQRIEHFRTELINIIKNMPNNDFELIRESVVKMKLKEDNDLGDEVTRNWTEVTSDEYIFDRAQQEVNELRAITQNDLLQFYLSHYGDKEQKLSIQVIGNPNAKHSEDDINVDKSTFNSVQLMKDDVGSKGYSIQDINQFKNSLQRYPISRTHKQ